MINKFSFLDLPCYLFPLSRKYEKKNGRSRTRILTCREAKLPLSFAANVLKMSGQFETFKVIWIPGKEAHLILFYAFPLKMKLILVLASILNILSKTFNCQPVLRRTQYILTLY